MRKVSTRTYLIYRNYKRVSSPGLNPVIYVEKPGFERREHMWSQLRACYLQPPMYITDTCQHQFLPSANDHVSLWVECGHDSTQYARRLTLLPIHPSGTTISRSKVAVSGTDEICQQMQRARYILVDQQTLPQPHVKGNQKHECHTGMGNSAEIRQCKCKKHLKHDEQFHVEGGKQKMADGGLKVGGTPSVQSGDNSAFNGSFMREILKGYQTAIQNHEF